MEELVLKIESIANAAANTIAAPNWADKTSLLLSLLAIIVAGYVALKQAKISEQQNKIALFEKRYKVYSTILNIISIAEIIPTAKNMDDIYDIFHVTFEGWPSKEDPDAANLWMPEYFKIINQLDQAEFLFRANISEEFLQIKIKFMFLVDGIYLFDGKENCESRKSGFCSAVEKFQSKKVLEKVKAELQL